MKFKDWVAFVGMWLLVVFFLILVEFLFQLSQSYNYLSIQAPPTLARVFLKSTFLLTLAGMAIIVPFYLISLIFKNSQFLNKALVKILLFSISFAFISVFFLNFISWMFSASEVMVIHFVNSKAYKVFSGVFVILLSYLLYRYRSYSVYSFFKKQHRYVISVLSMLLIVALAIVVFEYPKYPQTYQIDTNKKRDLPNIILFSSDGINSEHMSLYGYERDTTPNLRELAESSIVFHRAYNSIPTSRGSVTSILTGKLPVTTGVLEQTNILQGLDSYQHLPGILKSLGYYNVDVGVITQTVPTALNLRNGFDEVNGRRIPLLFFKDGQAFNIELHFIFNFVERSLRRLGIPSVLGLSDFEMIKIVEKQ